MTMDDLKQKLSGIDKKTLIKFGIGVGAIILFLIIFVWPGGETNSLYGLDTNEYEHIRIVGPLCAIWYAVFIVPLFLFTPDLKKNDITVVNSIKIGLLNFIHTFI